MSISDYSDHTTQSSIFQDSLDNNGFLSSFQEKNDTPLQQSVKLDYVHLIQQEHARKRGQMNDLRLSHARKRNSLAMRFGLMPTLDPFGGMLAPDYYDDGIINGSASHRNSLYKKPWQNDFNYDNRDF
jgi:hypothetical protein